MTAVLRIGGPRSRACPTCREPAGAGCVLLSGPDGRPVPWPRARPHRCRIAAAPEQEARPGDLVVLCLAGREILAVVLGAGEHVAVRTWSDASGWAPGAGHVAPWQILRLAPEDATTAAARAALAGAP